MNLWEQNYVSLGFKSVSMNHWRINKRCFADHHNTPLLQAQVERDENGEHWEIQNKQTFKTNSGRGYSTDESVEIKIRTYVIFVIFSRQPTFLAPKFQFSHNFFPISMRDFLSSVPT